MTLCTVLRSVDHASLWKHIITVVVGRSALYFFTLHLDEEIEN